MDKKKILIVSRSFYPIIAPRSFRATELAIEFAKQGHEVTILTHKRKIDYTKFEDKHNLIIKDFVKGKWNDIQGKNILIKAFKFFLKYIFLFPDIQLVTLLKKELKDYTGYDSVISVAFPYPVHWGVALAKKRNPKLCGTWIADCGDPFMGNKELKLKYPFYFRFVENWFCKKPDYLTVPIKEAIRAYPSFCRKKIKVIPQGFNFEESKNKNNKPNNPIPTFAYAGLLSKGIRDPCEFLEYLCTKNNYSFKFILYTKSSSIVEPYKNRLGDKLEIRDYLPREQLLKELSTMDFLVNFENKNSVQRPSKLVDYYFTGRPVISVNTSKSNKKVIDEFLIGNYTNKMIISDIDRHDIKNVANQFIELIS
jgi:glycosyltransferase involved in cell wall biosynthesis